MGKPPNTVLQLSFISSPARAELTQAEAPLQNETRSWTEPGLCNGDPTNPNPLLGE